MEKKSKENCNFNVVKGQGSTEKFCKGCSSHPTKHSQSLNLPWISVRLLTLFFCLNDPSFLSCILWLVRTAIGIKRQKHLKLSSNSK